MFILILNLYYINISINYFILILNLYYINISID